MGYRSLARKKSNLRRAGGWQVQTLDLLILFILVFYLNKLTEKNLTFLKHFLSFLVYIIEERLQKIFRKLK